MSGSHMATFHRFPRLPYEIRAMIWRLAAVRREVQIKAKDKPRTVTDAQRPDDGKHREIAYLFSPTPVPAVLHTCRESRKESRYEKLFYSDETEPCYVWVIFDLDRLDVGQDLQCLEHNKPRVRSLSVELEDDEEVLLDASCQNLCSFQNLVGCRVSVNGLFADWGGAYVGIWSCLYETHLLYCIAEDIEELVRNREFEEYDEEEDWPPEETN